MMRHDKLSIISGFLVFIIAALAFVLSFDAIMQLAVANDINPKLAWIVPLIVDGAMAVFSVAVLRATLANEGVLWGWCLIVSFTAVSVAFNIAHSNLKPFGIVIAGLAPLALFFSFETLMSQIRSTVQGGINALAKHWQGRAKCLLRLAKEWRGRANQLERIVNEYKALVNQRESELSREKDRRKSIEERLKAIESGVNHLNPLAKDIYQLIISGEGTGAAIAEKHGVSEAHVSKIKSYLNGSGK